MSSYNVFSTKQLSSYSLHQLKEAGIVITEKDFIRIQPVASAALAETITTLMYDDIVAVFTSANAVDAFKYLLAKSGDHNKTGKWKIFCLSGRTRDAVLDIFDPAQVIDVAGDAAVLAEKITSKKIKDIFFFCGNQRRDELPSFLQAHGVQVNEVVLYETIETPSTITTEPDAVLFFSPSAVKSFFSANSLSPAVVCFAIGNTTAATISDFTDNKIIISNSPGQEAMLDTVQHYFRNINCYK